MHPETQMRREMREQPAAVAATLEALTPLRDALRALADSRRHVLYVARGSSDNACVYARYLTEIVAGRLTGSAAPSVVTHYGARLDLSQSLVVAVSQSGHTDDIVATQEWARACGAATVAVTNDAASPLATTSDLCLPTQAGTEQAVPATKTYTSQLAALGVLVSALADDTALLDDLRRAPDEVAALLDAAAGVDEATALLTTATRTLVTGRGLQLATSLEVALKVEETCLRPTRALSYADLRHGPIAIVDETTVAVLTTSDTSPTTQPMVELAHDLRRRGASTVAIGGGEAMAEATTVYVEGPRLPDRVAPLATVVPGQLVTEGLALSLGLDPDAPRGLSKVTVTDV